MVDRIQPLQAKPVAPAAQAPPGGTRYRSVHTLQATVHDRTTTGPVTGQRDRRAGGGAKTEEMPHAIDAHPPDGCSGHCKVESEEHSTTAEVFVWIDLCVGRAES